MRNDRERLEDIAEAIDRILEKTVVGWPGFERDLLLQVWVVHHLQIIGEAAGIAACSRWWSVFCNTTGIFRAADAP
jgi:uncharacterized protein with HEPN domain